MGARVLVTFLAFSSRTGAHRRWKCSLTAYAAQSYDWFGERGFCLIQHAFAPQGGGRIEDAMRRVTAAPRSWRVGSIESRPDLGSRSFSILLQVADSCLFLKQKTYSEFVVRKHAKTAQATRRFCFRDNIWCFVTEEKRHEYQGCERVKTAQPTRQFQKRSHFDETHTACIFQKFKNRVLFDKLQLLVRFRSTPGGDFGEKVPFW